MPLGMTKVPAPAPTTVLPKQEGQSSQSWSFYRSTGLKVYTPAEIEHCEVSITIKKYIGAKIIQNKNTGMAYKTRMQTFAQFVSDVTTKHLLTISCSRLKLENMTHTIF
jgi:hypothetical protein